ncbi:MAG: S-adenosylmethionine synthetase [Candidatus Magnetoglobus multicellularis str. Araruama]|uniref:Methionine adenosyltransferase n=1 Tax=Candidatus Magnetoglobus multicellularis str. Araruama TaxID=890399 RepID=A0A1V1PH93_9BACT|nr:MAG: S-adenosylmethionine synthetase [Candidatus Magnetoglobus multicellularis str. Araruama]
MGRDFMVTSESVTEGHPDKLCDKISDAIVDNYLLQDPFSRVRVQCALSSAIVFIAARHRSKAIVDLSHVARKVIRDVGFDQKEFNANACSILTSTQDRKPDPKYQFDEKVLTDEEIDQFPVRNQVSLFGFACDQTPNYMPLPIYLAHLLTRRIDDIRHAGQIAYLEPEAKVQVGVEYRNREPHRVHTVVINASQKTNIDIPQKQLQEDIQEMVIEPTFKEETLKPFLKTRIFINPNGPVKGGPAYHSGLAGRKNAIDTYGEYCRHSGKALSGKDPIRIDRIGAYAARHAAKNIVAAGLAKECEIMLSYSMGLTKPVTFNIETFGTGKYSDNEIIEIVKDHFDFRLGGILKKFNLRHLPSERSGLFYQQLSTYGQMGRMDLDLPWEKTDKADLIK